MMAIDSFEEQIDSWRNPKRKLKNRKNYIKLQIQRQMLVWISSGQVTEVISVYKKYKVDYSLDIDWKNSRGESVLSQAEVYDNSAQAGCLGVSCYQKIQELMGHQQDSSSDKVREVIRSRDDKELSFLLSHYTKARLPYDVMWEVLQTGIPDQMQEILHRFPNILSKIAIAGSQDDFGGLQEPVHKPTWSDAEKFSASLKLAYFSEDQAQDQTLIFLALRLKLWNFASTMHASPSYLPTEDIIQALAGTDFLKNSWADHLLAMLYKTCVLPKHSETHNGSKPDRRTVRLCCSAFLAALDKQNVPMLELVMAYGGISFEDSLPWIVVPPCPLPCQVHSWWWWGFDYEAQKVSAWDIALTLLTYGAIPDVCYDSGYCHILVKVLYSRSETMTSKPDLLMILVGGIWDINNIKSVIYPYQHNSDNTLDTTVVGILQKQLSELSLEHDDLKPPKNDDSLQNTPTRRSTRHNSKSMNASEQRAMEPLSECTLGNEEEPLVSRKSTRRSNKTTKTTTKGRSQRSTNKHLNNKQEEGSPDTMDQALDPEDKENQNKLSIAAEVPFIAVQSNSSDSFPRGGRLTPHPMTAPPKQAPSEACSLLDCAVSMSAGLQTLQLLMDAGCKYTALPLEKDLQDALNNAGPRSLLYLCRAAVRNQIATSSSQPKSLHQAVGTLPISLKLKDFILFLK